MLWYASGVVTTPMILLQKLRRLKTEQLQIVNVAPSVFARWKETQARCVELLEPLFGLQPDARLTGLASSQESVQTNFMLAALHWVETQCEHIMTFSRMQALTALFSMIKGAIARIIVFNGHTTRKGILHEAVRIIMCNLLHCAHAHSLSARLVRSFPLFPFLRRALRFPLVG